jgi:CP family cyanate transporter-like MFS transporter
MQTNMATLIALSVLAPVWPLTAFSIILGLGQGGAFGLALSLIVLRAGDQHVAT